MNRYLVLAATAVLAVTSVSFQPQTAEAGFLRRVLFRGGHHHSGPFGHHHHRRVFIAPIVAAPVLAAPAMRAPAASQGMPSAPRNADGSGRVFDPASMAWTDGRNQCWSGKQPWSFRSGSWFYGNDRWYPANGTWLTSAPEPPTPIDCQSVAAFAPSRTTTTSSASRYEKPTRGEAAANSTAERGSECTKYSASIGQVIKVPCDG
jgi:hypothetical protein